MSDSQPSDALSMHDSIIDNIHKFLEESSPSLTKNTDQIILALLARLLCGADSVSTLSNYKRYAYIPVILRSMLEARIDLINLVQNSDYIKIMTYKFSQQEIKFLDCEIMNSSKDDSSSTKQLMIERFDKAMTYCEENSNIANDSRIRERFDQADLISEYFVTYNLLCRSSHNNIDQLIADHFPYGGTRFFTHTSSTTNNIILRMFMSANMCVHGAEIVAHHFHITGSHLEETKEQYKKLELLVQTN
jgi:hypothetical protein